MPKRKRDDDDQGAEVNSSAKQHRIEHKLKLGATKVGHAFKVAKGFERTKLGRRRKTAVSEGNAKDVTRIDAEIEALKVCEMPVKTSRSAFANKLCRRLIHRHQLRNTCSRSYRRTRP